MSNDELQKLKALALAATPGPWAMEDDEVSDSAAPIAYVGSEIDAVGAPATGMRIMVEESHVWPNRQPKIGGFSWRQLEKKALANAAYVAAANPATILRLIECAALATPAVASGALPELPQAGNATHGGALVWYEAQMRAYGQACAAAAAPNAALVEALKAILSDFEGCYADGEPAIIAARAALAQAGAA